MMDKHNYFQIETREVIHPRGWIEPVSIEKWYWAVLDFATKGRDQTITDIIAGCEEHRGPYDLAYALRYYAQEYWEAYERYEKGAA